MLMDRKCFADPKFNMYITSFFDLEDIITLYHNHAIYEQFHSDIKTDMRIERLPSGKFDTKAWNYYLQYSPNNRHGSNKKRYNHTSFNNKTLHNQNRN